jgi:hypothetical protein
MYLSSIENFNEEVEQIKEYLLHIDHVNKVLESPIPTTSDEAALNELHNLKEHYKEYKTDKKIFEYKAVIISLYGLLEKSIEFWVQDYLDALSVIIPSYQDLNNRIIENHFDLSLKLINIITTQQRDKFQHITKEDVLKKLNFCIENKENYKLNTEGFIISSGNLRHSKIAELFNLIDVNVNNGLKRSDSLNELIKRELGVENINDLKTDILYRKVNNIVDRRNEIAHGAERIENILKNSEFTDYINFLSAYCQAIYNTLYEEMVSYESIHKFKRFSHIKGLWNNNILGIEIEKYKIKVGDMLIIKTADNRFIKSPILSIQINNVPLDEVSSVEKMDIAIKVDAHLLENQEFYLINANSI